MYAGATTYEGTLGNIRYICRVSGKTSSVTSNITTDRNAKLKARTNTYVFKFMHGEPVYVKNVVLECETPIKVKQISFSFTYANIETMFSLPTSGFFQRTVYDSYINGGIVLNGVSEVFFQIQ